MGTRILPPPALDSQPGPRVRWLVGVDGGGTRTRLRLCDLRGRRLGESQSGPSALGQGVEPAWREIASALRAAAADAGLASPPWNECAVGAGLSGANVVDQAERFLDLEPGCGFARIGI